MRRRTWIAASVMMIACMLAFTVAVSATEDDGLVIVMPTDTEGGSEGESGTVEGITEDDEETDRETGAAQEAERAKGIYDIGRRWAEENPEVFSAIVTAIGVTVYGLVQFIGFMKAKRTVVKSSNNAVEIYRIASKQIGDSNKETLVQIDEANRRCEEHIEYILKAAIQAMKGAQEAIEDARRGTARQTEEAVKDREAVILLSMVIGRLLEEASLPSRVRDEIHGLVTEARGKLEENRNEESAGE